MRLKLDINTDAPDEIYEALIKMHEGLDEETSALVNAKMILVLANHIGDPAVICEAASVARGDR